MLMSGFEDMDGDKEPDYNDWFFEEDDSFEEDFVNWTVEDFSSTCRKASIP